VIAAVACSTGAAAPAGASAATGHDGRIHPAYQYPYPDITLAKTANVSSFSGPGITITYTYVVTNDGNTTLSPVTVTDPMAGLSQIVCPPSTTNVISSLAPGASVTCTATYLTTSADATRGYITNIGSASGTTPANTAVGYNASLTLVEPGHSFPCTTPQYFLSQSYSSSPAETLYATAPTGPAYTYTAYPNPYATGYNAIGFDKANHFIYGINNSNQLIQIDGTGSVYSTSSITGFPTTGVPPVVGAFDNSNNMYYVTGGGGSTLMYEIAVTGPGAPKVVSTTNLSSSYYPNDWTWSGSYFWGMSGQTGYRVSASGAVTSFSVPWAPASSYSYGGDWTFGNNDIGLSDNSTGAIYEVHINHPTTTPSFTQVTTYPGPQSYANTNDATSCPGQNDTDLAIANTAESTVAPGSPITWNLTVTNNGPGNSSGFVLNDTTKGKITGLSTSTPGCSVVGKSLQVQCGENVLFNGDSFTVTLSGKAPAAAGTCVTNTASVIANEADPNSSNNTSTAQTCTQKITSP
jgi:uncharacterized repeat protein (TIGR01451 family)